MALKISNISDLISPKLKKFATPSFRKIKGEFELSQDVVEISNKTASKFDSISLQKITPDIVAKLKGLQGVDFIIESRNVLAKMMGIPEEYWPQILVLEKMPRKTQGALYKPITMQIFLPQNYSQLSKRNQLSLLAHEMQHHRQNLTVFRSNEALWQKAKSKYLEEAINMSRQNQINVIESLSDDEFSKVLETSKDIAPSLKKIRENIIKGKGQEAFLATEDLIPLFRQMNENSLNATRAKILEKMGNLPEKQEKLAQRYFNGLFNTPDNPLSIRYLISETEIEANLIKYKIAMLSKKLGL